MIHCDLLDRPAIRQVLRALSDDDLYFAATPLVMQRYARCTACLMVVAHTEDGLDPGWEVCRPIRCPALGWRSFDGQVFCDWHDAQRQPCARCGRREVRGFPAPLCHLCWRIDARRPSLVGTEPQRFRLSRARGARKPPHAVTVTRSSDFGNPFPLVHQKSLLDARARRQGKPGYVQRSKSPQMHEVAMLLFEAYYAYDAAYRHVVRFALAGCDLCCWCPPGWPCHADVLLRWANEE